MDSLRRFDCISQRSIARIKSIRLSPATECLVRDGEAAAQRLKAALEKGAGHAMEKEADDSLSLSVSADDEDGLPSLDDFLSELDAMELAEDLLKEGKSAKAKEKKTEKQDKEEDLNWKRHMDDVERVRAGHTIRTATMWMNVLCEDTVTVADYLTSPIILLDRPDQYQGRIRTAEAAFSEAYEDARLRGDAFDAQQTLRFTYDDLLNVWNTAPSITLSDIIATSGRMAPGAAVSFGAKPPMPYQSRLEPLKQDIVKWKEEGHAIILLTGGEARGKRLQKALEEQGVPSVYAETLDGNLIVREVVLLPVAYGKGFIHPEAHLVVLSDTDV